MQYQSSPKYSAGLFLVYDVGAVTGRVWVTFTDCYIFKCHVSVLICYPYLYGYFV